MGRLGAAVVAAAVLSDASPARAAAAAAAACNVSASPDSFCADFCSGRCAFFNASAGEAGAPETVTVFRLTPSHITDLPNKDSGDPFGDLSFFLSRHNLRAECTQDPHAHGNGCFLAGQNVFVKYEVEVDGQWGPYQVKPLPPPPTSPSSLASPANQHSH